MVCCINGLTLVNYDEESSLRATTGSTAISLHKDEIAEPVPSHTEESQGLLRLRLATTSLLTATFHLTRLYEFL